MMKTELEVVDVYDLGSSGDGVARLDDGAVVFVPGALPGDRVGIRRERKRKGVYWAHLENIIEPSPDRIASLCREEECGGCQLKNLEGQKQKDMKYRRIIETIRRIGGVDIEELVGPIIEVGDGWHYRHRVRLHCRWRNNRWRLGFFARKSHRLIALTDCPVLWPELLNTAHSIENLIVDLPRSVGLHEIEIVYSRRDGKAAAFFDAQGDVEPCRDLLSALPLENLIGIEISNGVQQRRLGKLLLRYDHAQAQNFDLFFEPGLFTQTFPAANDKLIETVNDFVRPETQPKVLELHAGIGNFSTSLARQGAELTASEINPNAALLCKRNLRTMGLSNDVLVLDDLTALEKTSGPWDVVLLDPPRTGAAAAVKRLAQDRPERIVYVSCDPATFARDCKTLMEVGYTLKNIKALEMFPQTTHIETVALLTQ